MWLVSRLHTADSTLTVRAFDLEKRQHAFAAGQLKPLRPDETGLLGGTKYQVERAEDKLSDVKSQVKKDL